MMVMMNFMKTKEIVEQLEFFKKDLPSAVDDAAAVMSYQFELSLNNEYQIRGSKDIRFREDEPITWKEAVKDPESIFILFCLVATVALMIFW